MTFHTSQKKLDFEACTRGRKMMRKPEAHLTSFFVFVKKFRFYNETHVVFDSICWWLQIACDAAWLMREGCERRWESSYGNFYYYKLHARFFSDIKKYDKKYIPQIVLLFEQRQFIFQSNNIVLVTLRHKIIIKCLVKGQKIVYDIWLINWKFSDRIPVVLMSWRIWLIFPR
jgi:hypothetical protein